MNTASKKSILVVLSFALCGVLGASPQTTWHVSKNLAVGGEGGWDYLTVDPDTHRLYIPRSTHTLVVDPETGKTIADIPGQKNAHGVAIVPQVGRGFISDGGGAGGIVVFDLKTNAVLGTLAAQPDADGIIYDPGTNLVVVVSGDKGVLMAFKPDIDPKGGKIETTVDLGGAPEFLAADGAGKVYVNIMDKNEVAVFDLNAKKVINRWPVAPGGAPVGLALDAKEHRLYVGCRKPQKLVVLDTETGKVVADLPIGDHVDAVKVDDGQVFSSCGDGTLAVVHESGGKYEISQTVKTLKGAKTMGVDPSTHLVYLPTTESGAKKSPFVVVVVAAK